MSKLTTIIMILDICSIPCIAARRFVKRHHSTHIPLGKLFGNLSTGEMGQFIYLHINNVCPVVYNETSDAYLQIN
jgi:hypothetical protein